MAEDADNPSRVQRCPICSKTALQQFRPFCSRRCADVDLNRWLSGVYVVPSKMEDDESDQPRDEQMPADRSDR